MSLRWVRGPGGGDNSWRGYDDKNYLVATVSRYDAPYRHWLAFVRLDPLPGRHGTDDEAKAAVEAHLAPGR